MSPYDPLIECRFFLRKFRFARALLLAAAAFLAVALWMLSFDTIPGLPAPPGALAARWGHTPQTLAERLGEWIRLTGFDSGPPSEYACDFLVFWFLAACEGLYLVYYARLRRMARGLGDSLTVTPLTPEERAALFLPPRHAAFLTVRFPALMAAILLLSPWDGDNGAQKTFLLLFGIPILLMTAASFRIALKKPPVTMPAHRIEWLYVYLLLAGPIHGNGNDVLLLMLGMAVQLAAIVFSHIRAGNTPSSIPFPARRES